jgi:hypothetical protein
LPTALSSQWQPPPAPQAPPGPYAQPAGPSVQSHALNLLKNLAKQFLPVAAGKLADRYVKDGSGDWVEAGAAALADTLLGENELEGLSGEDREFEIARRYVRLAIDALERALQAPPRVPTPVAARIAVTEAARAHAPGLVPIVPRLLNASPRNRSDGHGSGGRWTRRGGSIVVDMG